MSRTKKVVVTAAIILVVLIIANYAAGWWLEKKLPEALNSNKDFPYTINYEDADVQLLRGSMTIYNTSMAPKDTVEGMASGAYGKIKSVRVSGLNVWAYLFNDHIKTRSVTIEKPEVILYHRAKKYNAKDDFVEPFKQTISTKKLTIVDGSFRMLDSVQNFITKAQNIDFELENIKIDSTSAQKDIPLRYRGYKLSCDSLYYHINQHYNLVADKLETTDTQLLAEGFKLVPLQTRAEFNKSIPAERDQFTVSAKTIRIPNNDWGYLNDTLFVHAPEVMIEEVNTGIYRGKMVQDDNSVKKLYSELLREIDFDLKLDKITLKKCNVVYEEQISYDRKPGRVTLSNLYASIYNVYSPVRKTKFPQTKIDVKCTFMNAAPLSLNWTFDIPDHSDAFTIQGTIGHLKAEEINPVSSGLMNIKTTGDINKVKFTLHGNKNSGQGSFAIDYSDLKVEVLEKDGTGKKNLMSLLGNLAVKNDSEGGLKDAGPVALARPKTKSVFNFLWQFNQQGLKQTILKTAAQKLTN